ncbi:MAG: segregation/condensation protein A, partial [Candidatus Aenigmatarchaeota archaeon]
MGGVTEKTIMDLIVSDYPWEQVIYKIICEEAMDPWDLDLTKLTEVFVDVLAKMKKLDFRIPAKYIIIAAVLLKMKSDHLDFIDMVKESLAGPDPYPEDMFENAEETEVPQETLASGGTKFDAVKLHERRVHLYQYGCCLCGAITLADGTWARLAVPGLPQSVTTSQGSELTTYRVS